jgi:DnaJ-related protein SCJ1
MRALVVAVLLLMVLVHSQRETYLYELLEVTEKATSDELKKAFRRLSIKFHPDRHADNPDALKKYVEIKHAYEVLIDVSKRITYDLHGEAGLKELEKNPLRKGGDFRTEMWVPLDKFYTGGEMVYSFRRGEICKQCKGTGDAGGQKQTCPACGGSGKMVREVNVKGEVKKIEMKCKACGGSGIGAASKCSACGGNKIIIAPRDLTF